MFWHFCATCRRARPRLRFSTALNGVCRTRAARSPRALPAISRACGGSKTRFTAKRVCPACLWCISVCLRCFSLALFANADSMAVAFTRQGMWQAGAAGAEAAEDHDSRCRRRVAGLQAAGLRSFLCPQVVHIGRVLAARLCVSCAPRQMNVCMSVCAFGMCGKACVCVFVWLVHHMCMCARMCVYVVCTCPSPSHPHTLRSRRPRRARAPRDISVARGAGTGSVGDVVGEGTQTRRARKDMKEVCTGM